MAEGLVNHFLADRWEARSAGTQPALQVHPLAVEAMAEIGIDISAGVPESVDLYKDDRWDLVFTVCDSAKKRCPVFTRPVEQLHISFDDPAYATGAEEERRAAFRRVRDEIRDRLVDAVRKHG
jgi:arsenate reductase